MDKGEVIKAALKRMDKQIVTNKRMLGTIRANQFIYGERNGLKRLKKGSYLAEFLKVKVRSYNST